jgi:hypothetical protein
MVMICVVETEGKRIWRMASSEEKISAVTLDALGTIVRLEPPAPRLVRAMADRGISISIGTAERAFAAEISFYRAHHLRGSDAAGLNSLRMSCAEVLGKHLPPAVQVRIGTALSKPQCSTACNSLRSAEREMCCVGFEKRVCASLS